MSDGIITKKKKNKQQKNTYITIYINPLIGSCIQPLKYSILIKLIYITNINAQYFAFNSLYIISTGILQKTVCFISEIPLWK